MKKVRKASRFNWSRTPSRDTIYKVFLADPDAYSYIGKHVTKDELSNSLAVYNKIKALEQKKQFFRRMFLFTLAAIPVSIFMYNVFIGVSR